jgi:nitroreductase
MTPRTADHAIDPMFLRRHSPRAMSGAPLPREELMRLLEAARWAPSSANGQPWRFVVCERGDPSFATIHGLLAAGNQPWTARAAALIVILTDTVRTAADGTKSPSRLAAFDAGAAWMSLALQGAHQGLVVHGMEGFDQVATKVAVGAADHLDVLAVIAVGLPGDPALLTADWQRAGEAPNQRRPIAESVVFGGFAPRS